MHCCSDNPETQADATTIRSACKRARESLLHVSATGRPGHVAWVSGASWLAFLGLHYGLTGSTLKLPFSGEGFWIIQEWRLVDTVFHDSCSAGGPFKTRALQSALVLPWLLLKHVHFDTGRQELHRHRAGVCIQSIFLEAKAAATVIPPDSLPTITVIGQVLQVSPQFSVDSRVSLPSLTPSNLRRWFQARTLQVTTHVFFHDLTKSRHLITLLSIRGIV